MHSNIKKSMRQKHSRLFLEKYKGIPVKYACKIAISVHHHKLVAAAMLCIDTIYIVNRIVQKILFRVFSSLCTLCSQLFAYIKLSWMNAWKKIISNTFWCTLHTNFISRFGTLGYINTHIHEERYSLDLQSIEK